MDYEAVFPDDLKPIALALLPTLAIGELQPAKQGFVVNVKSQLISAPSRVYYSPARPRSEIRSSGGEARTLALCLGTRHWDGFVREECIRELVHINCPWVAPFVIQLLGEYVIQIVNVITEALPHVNRTTYGEFVRTNPRFLATTKRRATSYWDCYYRHHYSRLGEYPALLVIEQMEKMAMKKETDLF
jgi:hypothetical protein